MVVLMLLYVYVAQHLFEKSEPSSSSTGGKNAALEDAVKQFVADNKADFPQQQAKQQEAVSSVRNYAEWKAMALNLAAQSPDVVLAHLNQYDPFGVRHFEAALLDAESNKGAFLTLPEVRTLFSCPPHDHRITVPDQRRHESESKFRDSSSGSGGTYLFFQHLRKAGGTNFCALAQSNLKRTQVPSYFCMPDMDWSGQKCAGCLHSYSNAKIDKNMQGIGHKIVGNEWDPFEASRFFDLDAIFATSFRKPLDRALSQFRFECIEERGCVIKNVEEWWSKRRADLTNVYVWTFSNRGIRKASIQNTRSAIAARQEALGVALDAVAKFNVVLVMEWLAYATDTVETVLGFHNLESLTKRVRPHIAQAKRDDGQDVNSMGAAGIKKASWDPQTYLSKEQYKVMSEDLALDEILTDAARRMFLERLVCDDEQQQ